MILCCFPTNLVLNLSVESQSTPPWLIRSNRDRGLALLELKLKNTTTKVAITDQGRDKAGLISTLIGDHTSVARYGVSGRVTQRLSDKGQVELSKSIKPQHNLGSSQVTKTEMNSSQT